MIHYRTNPPSRQIKPRPPVPKTGRELHALVIRHLAKTGMAPTTFGRQAANDPGLVSVLRSGVDPRPSTIARVFAFITEANNA
jgi:hypothetical protein